MHERCADLEHGARERHGRAARVTRLQHALAGTGWLLDVPDLTRDPGGSERREHDQGPCVCRVDDDRFLGSESRADREKLEQSKKKAPPTAPVPTLDVRKLMTQKAFQSAGLAKLDAGELDALNQWLTDFAMQVLAEKQSRAGCQTPIETSIDGEFEGWSGDTVFKLMNGQIWKQSSYSYTYSYKYSPSVLIYKSGSSCKLKVDGVDGEISVERLK